VFLHAENYRTEVAAADAIPKQLCFIPVNETRAATATQANQTLQLRTETKSVAHTFRSDEVVF
jgi:hypothetical protein